MTERKLWPLSLKDTLMKKQEYKCFVCKQPIGWLIGQGLRNFYPTFEHIKPLSAEGKDCLENLAVSHRGCNERRCHDQI